MSENHSNQNAESQDERIVRYGFEKNFFLYPNSTATSKKLSFEAKGLLAHLLSLPSDWEIHVWQLVNEYKDVKGASRDSIRKMLNELKNAGYVEYIKYQNEKGHWVHFYKVYPLPIENYQQIQKICPETVLPALVKPAPEIPAPVKPAIYKDTETKTEKQKQSYSVCVAEPPVKNFGPVEEKKEAAEANLPPYEKITKEGFKGKTHQVCKNDLFVYSVQKRNGWKVEEIDEAWRILLSYSDPIGDVFRFVEGTISNNRKLAGLKSYDEKIANSFKTQNKGSASSQKEKPKGYCLVNGKPPEPLTQEEIEADRNFLKSFSRK